MFPNNNLPNKKDVADQVLNAINKWLDKMTDYKGKIIYRSWIDPNQGLIKYDNFNFLVKCDLGLFLNINDTVYHIFINFKISHYIYELNSRKKALLVQKKNGLVSYDGEAKKAFRITKQDKNAIVIFVANNISKEQTNSWSSRVLCCHADNIIATIKNQLEEIKKQNASKKVVKSFLKK